MGERFPRLQCDENYQGVFYKDAESQRARGKPHKEVVV